MKTWVVLSEKQEKLYQKIGVDPQVVLSWLNKEIFKLLEKTEDIYGELNNLDEDLLVEALIETANLKKADRIKQQENNRKEAEDRRRKREELGKTKRKHLDSLMQNGDE